ncbi:uncharacterized protein LOC104418371 isoform X2 [Eucalyptus grandis]|uniref:uncharacterized protein LOC104418371 isoform X2 n=1 Tax=Eucalyptus grandis TaxID=71139 RepID=UPI00192EE14F|nr:uncharacterized protein LOC104418371 isoform X2 [Eucalyptus grandis]
MEEPLNEKNQGAIKGLLYKRLPCTMLLPTPTMLLPSTMLLLLPKHSRVFLKDALRAFAAILSSTSASTPLVSSRVVYASRKKKEK